MSTQYLALAFLTVAVFVTQAQQPQATTSKPPSEVILYGAFFRQVVQLDRLAAEQDAQRRNGDELRAYVKNAARLSEAEASVLKTEATACGLQVGQKDAEAQTLIRQIRSRTPGGRLKSRSELPPVPPELVQLQREHDEIVRAHIASLKAALGPQAFQKLDSYVTQTFARRVTVSPAGPGRPPKTTSTPALEAVPGGTRQ